MFNFVGIPDCHIAGRIVAVAAKAGVRGRAGEPPAEIIIGEAGRLAPGIGDLTDIIMAIISIADTGHARLGHGQQAVQGIVLVAGLHGGGIDGGHQIADLVIFRSLLGIAGEGHLVHPTIVIISHTRRSGSGRSADHGPPHWCGGLRCRRCRRWRCCW